MRAGRRILAAFGVLLPVALGTLAAGAIGAAQPGSPDRQRTIDGWLVEDIAGDGGRLVRISRTSGPYRLEYHAGFQRGNDRRLQGVSVARDGCRTEEAIDADLIVHESEIRSSLSNVLLACGASPNDISAALEGIDPAYALARAWNWEAATAENACDGPPVNGAADQDISEMNATNAALARPPRLLAISRFWPFLRKAPRPPTSARCADRNTAA